MQKTHCLKCATVPKLNSYAKKECDCDGYHTFGELYEHRIALWITLCHTYFSEFSAPVWRSKIHSDGSNFEGWFMLGLGKEKGQQITYHLPNSKWDLCDFAETLDNAPEFDGHTSDDVLERLLDL